MRERAPPAAAAFEAVLEFKVLSRRMAIKQSIRSRGLRSLLSAGSGRRARTIVRGPAANGKVWRAACGEGERLVLWDGASLWLKGLGLKGLALITLYPVGSVGRTTILRASGREARDGPDQSVPRGFDPRESRGHRSHPGRGGRPRRLARFSLSAQARFKTAPSGTRPVSRPRHSATASLRAMATMAMRRTRPF